MHSYIDNVSPEPNVIAANTVIDSWKLPSRPRHYTSWHSGFTLLIPNPIIHRHIVGLSSKGDKFPINPMSHIHITLTSALQSSPNTEVTRLLYLVHFIGIGSRPCLGFVSRHVVNEIPMWQASFPPSFTLHTLSDCYCMPYSRGQGWIWQAKRSSWMHPLENFHISAHRFTLPFFVSYPWKVWRSRLPSLRRGFGAQKLSF